MKKTKDFESFEESSKVSDIFSFSEKENQKQFLNEDFVFKFEDNKAQLGTDANVASLGKEDNPKDSGLDATKKDEDQNKKEQENEKLQEQVSESASSATTTTTTAASTSSAVGTVAAVTTSAVVLVVGGGIAIYGQTLEKPTICEFNEVVAVDNNIKFTLSLGNDQLKIDNGEEDTECDVVVELLCPSQEDFMDEVHITNFGKFQNEFNNLEYDTEYLLNVSQHVMMGTEKEYLLETPYSITTPKKDERPVVTNSLTMSKSVDPLGTATYYAQFTYLDEIPSYVECYLVVGMKFQSQPLLGEDGIDQDRIEWFERANFDPTSREKQKLVFRESAKLKEEEYIVGVLLWGENQHESLLYSTKINFADIPTTENPTGDNLYFRKVYVNGYFEYLEVYPSYSGDVSAYDAFSIIATFGYETSEPEEVFNRDILSVNSVSQLTDLMDAEQYFYSILKVSLAGISYGEATIGGDIVTEVLFEIEVDFSQVPTDYRTEPIQPEFNSMTFTPYISASSNVELFAIEFIYNDPDGYWTYFDITFTNTRTQETSDTYQIKQYPDFALQGFWYIPELLDDEQFYNSLRYSSGEYTWTLTAVSSYPGDDPTVTLQENVVFEMTSQNAETIEGSIVPGWREGSEPGEYYANLTVYAQEDSTTFNVFDHIIVYAVNLEDPDESYTYGDAEPIVINEQFETEIPVAGTDGSQEQAPFSIQVVGVSSYGSEITIYSEIISYFGLH